MRPIDGKTCIITGASSGIGKASAEQLASMGAHVIMVCRSQERGERAKTEVEAKSGSKSIELMRADLASLASVRAFAEEFAKDHESLHILLNNAGVARPLRSLTVDGFETTFQVNYLSHFLLTNLLLPVLKKSTPSRIINVSSVAHYSGHLNFDDLQMEKGYGVMRAYSQSKLALVLFTHELARRLKGAGVTANCLHPGAVATNIWGDWLGPAAFLGKVTRLFMLCPEKGAKTQVYLASSSDVEGVSGEYFEFRGKKESSAESYDQELAERLWDVSAKMVGLPAGGRFTDGSGTISEIQ
ncbi:MAG TPA: SDR family oxidoreductase [Nitrososphaerales archaeon]|nr:SDR family oxidoreductase [Nitrososphaerales archaeon]